MLLRYPPAHPGSPHPSAANQLRHIAALLSLPGALKINDCGQRSIWNEIGANTKNLYNGKCSTSKQGTSSEQKKNKTRKGTEEIKRKGKPNQTKPNQKKERKAKRKKRVESRKQQSTN